VTSPFDAPIGNPPTLEWVAITSLSIDSDYQRSTEASTSKKLIRDIAKAWDWRLFQPLSVSRRIDGSLWVVDGQHRLAAAGLRGDMPHLPCVISSQDSKLGEARAFVGLNKKRRALGAVDVFKALLVTGHPESVEVMQILRDAGLTIAGHSNYGYWKPGEIYCVPGLASAHRRWGEAVTRNAVTALSEAFDGQVLQFAGQLLRGLVVVFGTAGKEPGFDKAKFVARLGKNTQAQWIRKMRERQIAHDENTATAMANAMIEAYRLA
jgi:hypothetical protein